MYYHCNQTHAASVVVILFILYPESIINNIHLLWCRPWKKPDLLSLIFKTHFYTHPGSTQEVLYFCGLT